MCRSDPLKALLERPADERRRALAGPGPHVSMSNSRWTTALMAALMQASRADAPAFLNGGIGKEDAARLHALSKEYSLHIEFPTKRDEEFMAAAEVTITDLNGKLVFQHAGAGPIILVHLAPGTYRVTAQARGRTETQTATIGSHGSSTLYFHRQGEFRFAQPHSLSARAGS